jgi:hypothetical protein
MEDAPMVALHRTYDTEMQRCLVDCCHSPYPLARLAVFLQGLRDRGVSNDEIHQMERAMLRLLASLRVGGRRATTPEPPLIAPRS